MSADTPLTEETVEMPTLTATPVYDQVVAEHPMPTFTVDTSFRWEAPVRRPAAPRPGQRPVRGKKRK